MTDDLLNAFKMIRNGLRHQENVPDEMFLPLNKLVMGHLKGNIHFSI